VAQPSLFLVDPRVEAERNDGAPLSQDNLYRSASAARQETSGTHAIVRMEGDIGGRDHAPVAFAAQLYE
jgi:hypothetical protein